MRGYPDDEQAVHQLCAEMWVQSAFPHYLDLERMFYYTFAHVYLAAYKTVAERLTAKEKILLHLG